MLKQFGIMAAFLISLIGIIVALALNNLSKTSFSVDVPVEGDTIQADISAQAGWNSLNAKVSAQNIRLISQSFGYNCTLPSDDPQRAPEYACTSGKVWLAFAILALLANAVVLVLCVLYCCRNKQTTLKVALLVCVASMAEGVIAISVWMGNANNKVNKDLESI